jgi:hypothetical protein
LLAYNWLTLQTSIQPVNILRLAFSILLVVSGCHSFAQFSVATDASLLKNLSNHQKFWAFGQTVQLNFYPGGEKNAVYAWISYYTSGKFKNNFITQAKDPLTVPTEIGYTVHSDMRYRQISLGWKRYFVGAYNSENMWNVYGYAGFGLLLGKASNSFNKIVDTSLYNVSQPIQGSSAFRRLTIDGGLGTEFPLGTAVFVYSEVRTWLPTSHYPSQYLYKNNYNIPEVLAVNVGLRVLIE